MSITAKLSAASGMGSIVAWSLVQRAGRRSGQVSWPGIPGDAEALTREWLTEALCREHPGAEVIDVELRGGTAGTTTRRGLTVSYNEVGQKAELPTDLYSKSTPRLTSRMVAGLARVLESETTYYNHVRPRLDLESPRGHVAVYDARSHRSMIIIEDVAVTRDARFGDPTTLPVDRAMGESQVRTLAALHAAHWDGRGLDAPEFSWLRTTSRWWRDTAALLNFRALSVGPGIERALSVLPPQLAARRDALWPAHCRAIELNGRGPTTLVHQDLHLGNWYRAGDGTMGLVDWQCLARGGGLKDVAYALASGLRVEDRRAWEADLVAAYLDELAVRGVTDPPSFEAAWADYRRQTTHALFFWLFTIGAGPLQPAMQPEHVSLANLERIGAAVVDLDTLGALDRV